MELFAHNGIDHATTGEAALHSLSTTIITVIFVSAAVAALMLAAAWAVQRIEVKSNDKSREK